MSSNLNDSNNMIHLGNYEEFFILYMDNELNGVERKMVEDFLEVHPDLKAEMEILLSTRLTADDVYPDKESLMADQMKVSLIKEELLLYVDNELEASGKKELEQKLVFDKELQLQHSLLLRAKLDPSEKMVYPHKEELYHRSERVIFFRPWMRVAAAVILIAAAGIVYTTNKTSGGTGVNPGTASLPKITPKQNTSSPLARPDTENKEGQTDYMANNGTGNDPAKDNKNSRQPKTVAPYETKNQIAVIPPVSQDPHQTNDPVVIIQEKAEPITGIALLDAHKEIVNNPGVTSSLPERTTTIQAAETASNDKKGSVKGFLRRTTRLIEKRTGIDPTNEDGELLIGVIAVKLK